MGFIDRLLTWVAGWSTKKLQRRRASRGELMFAGLSPGSPYGWPGGWSQDRASQVRHYRHWLWLGIQARGKELGRHEPHIAHVEHKPQGQKRNAFTLRARRKALTIPRPHEELTPVEPDDPLAELLHTPNPYDTLADLLFEWDLFM